MDTTTCPECAAPAEVIDRFALESTDGPIEHVRVQCVRRHWFLCSTASLARHRAAAPQPAPQPAPRLAPQPAPQPAAQPAPPPAPQPVPQPAPRPAPVRRPGARPQPPSARRWQ